MIRALLHKVERIVRRKGGESGWPRLARMAHQNRPRPDKYKQAPPSACHAATWGVAAMAVRVE